MAALTELQRPAAEEAVVFGASHKSAVHHIPVFILDGNGAGNHFQIRGNKALRHTVIALNPIRFHHLIYYLLCNRTFGINRKIALIIC